uniref:UV-stimulated scaffold protein A homolog n=1 Tax=Ananas comosus var. bracteatus TaxID=296719 RepID=A0A6V7Q8L9_ANACO|nr:unnamed protein product [Ananas comosus var. bracteatus]
MGETGAEDEPRRSTAAAEQCGGDSGEAAVPRLIERATTSTAGRSTPPPQGHQIHRAILRRRDPRRRRFPHGPHEEAPLPVNSFSYDESQVRYLTVLIIDELFMRSKLFRSLFVVNLDQFLTLSVGFRRNMPLPPPSSIASNLRKKTIELLEKWNASFGIHYRQVRLGFDYLKNTLKFQFPNRLENAARLQQERRERERRTQEILLSKLENLKENYSSIKAEIQSTVDEIGECFEIINSQREEFTSNEDEVEEFKSFELQQIRLGSLKEGEKVCENNENTAVFDALRELHKLLVSKHLASVQEWISVLIRVELADNKFRDMALKEMIDIRNNIQSVRNRCKLLGCVLDDAHEQKAMKVDEEEEDLWEEGKVEIYNSGPSSINDSSVVNDMDVQSTSNDKTKPLDGRASSSNLERSKLLAEAPVMTWGPFLDNWGANRDALANQRGSSLMAIGAG